MKKVFLVLPLILLFIGILLGLKKVNTPEPIESKIRGVILPHHDLAKELFHASFKRLKEKINPETIVIFGTNHYFPISEIYTTTNEVKNKYGLIGVLGSDERIKKEHSIQTLLLYIKEYFPDSKVIPIIVSSRYSFEELNNQVLSFIEKFGSKNTLYIASVDFAHNVSLEDGLSKNKESIFSISNFDYNEILKYEDDHMDSPVAITTLLLTMQKIGAETWETWYSSHGALITNVLDLNGTSYVIGCFVEK